jgi:hypothetical protein
MADVVQALMLLADRKLALAMQPRHSGPASHREIRVSHARPASHSNIDVQTPFPPALSTQAAPTVPRTAASAAAAHTPAPQYPAATPVASPPVRPHHHVAKPIPPHQSQQESVGVFGLVCTAVLTAAASWLFWMVIHR